MITDFNTIELPAAHDDHSLARLLHSFAYTPLPAFVIRRAGATADEALKKITPLAPRNMTFTGREIPFNDNMEGYKHQGPQDFDLHVDFDNDDNLDVTGINLHHTYAGRVRGIFFLPGIELLKDLGKGEDPRLPQGTDSLFDYGEVDTDFMQSTCYQADTRPGDAILFKEGLPLVHKFTTLEWPRGSYACVGVLATPCLVKKVPAA